VRRREAPREPCGLAKLPRARDDGLMPRRRLPGRKLLVASLGVATMNFVGLSCSSSGSSRNFAPLPRDAGTEEEAASPFGLGPGNDAGDVTTAPSPDAGTGDAEAGDAARDAVEEYPVANLAVP
jgi:hypothetical protein